MVKFMKKTEVTIYKRVPRASAIARQPSSLGWAGQKHVGFRARGSRPPRPETFDQGYRSVIIAVGFSEISMVSTLVFNTHGGVVRHRLYPVAGVHVEHLCEMGKLPIHLSEPLGRNLGNVCHHPVPQLRVVVQQVLKKVKRHL